MKIAERDLEDIRRMLRLDMNAELPPELEQSVVDWSGMFHRTGASGALGPVMLVPLLWAAGYRPHDVPRETDDSTDWREVATDGSVRIKATLDGGRNWLPGVFLEPSGLGWYFVKLDGRDDPVEVRKTDLRLVPGDVEVVADGTETREPVNVPANHTVDARKGLLIADSPIPAKCQELLLAAGLNTVSEVLEHPDLTTIKGIGQPRAEEILAAVSSLETV